MMVLRAGRFIMKKDRQSGFFGGLYHRNETFLILSAVIFLVSIVIGYIHPGILDSFLGSQLQNFQKSISEGAIQLTTLSIFTNNFLTALAIYALGFLFGVLTIWLLFLNGAFVGYVGSKVNVGNFLIFTLPHGVFEITAIVISGAAGFRLASGVFHFLNGVTKLNPTISIRNQLGYLLEANADEFKDSLKLFAITVVLLLIAAIIEANFTIAWGNYIKGVL